MFMAVLINKFIKLVIGLLLLKKFCSLFYMTINFIKKFMYCE